MIPCYVSGKGMHATETTHAFKVTVIAALEASGLGYDTKYRYYRKRFPGMEPGKLARMVCDPVEQYDPDWKTREEVNGPGETRIDRVTGFMLSLDERFREEARCAIYCYDEAGFGSGINTMRFLTSGKPVLGFYDPGHLHPQVNLSNILQLPRMYPDLVTLVEYRSTGEVPDRLRNWFATGFRADP